MCFTRAGALFLVLGIAGCGYGQYGTCRTPCDDPKEERDIECVCGSTHNDTHILTPPLPQPGAFIYFDWIENECSTVNRDYWLGNRNPKIDYYAIVSERSSNPDDPRIFRSPVRIKANAQTKSEGIRLGLEEVKGLDGKCYDKDFQLVRAWPSNYPSYESFLDAKKLMRMRLLPKSDAPPSKTSFIQAQKHALKIQKLRPKNQFFTLQVNCEQECLEGQPSCARAIPDDQKRLEQTRHTIESIPTQSGTLSKGALLSIFGVTVDSCERSDAFASAGRVFNRGQACVYPVLVEGDTKNPAPIVMHLTEVTKAAVTKNSDTTSLVFPAAEMAPNIFYRSIALDADYGGQVTEISSTPNGIFYKTASGSCTSMETKR